MPYPSPELKLLWVFLHQTDSVTVEVFVVIIENVVLVPVFFFHLKNTTCLMSFVISLKNTLEFNMIWADKNEREKAMTLITV